MNVYGRRAWLVGGNTEAASELNRGGTGLYDMFGLPLWRDTSGWYIQLGDHEHDQVMLPAGLRLVCYTLQARFRREEPLRVGRYQAGAAVGRLNRDNGGDRAIYHGYLLEAHCNTLDDLDRLYEGIRSGRLWPLPDHDYEAKQVGPPPEQVELTLRWAKPTWLGRLAMRMLGFENPMVTAKVVYPGGQALHAEITQTSEEDRDMSVA